MQVHVSKPELVQPVKGCAQTTVCIKMAEKIQVIEKKRVKILKENLEETMSC